MAKPGDFASLGSKDLAVPVPSQPPAAFTLRKRKLEDGSEQTFPDTVLERGNIKEDARVMKRVKVEGDGKTEQESNVKAEDDFKQGDNVKKEDFS